MPIYSFNSLTNTGYAEREAERRRKKQEAWERMKADFAAKRVITLPDNLS